MRAKLEALESAARPLEPSADERDALGRMAFDHAARFFAALPEAPANVSREQVFARCLDPEFPEVGLDPADALDYIARCVDAPGIATASPRFMGYIPGGGLYHSAIADFLAAAANKYAGFASAGPGAARLENATIGWLARVIGFPETAAGTLTSGGSIANLSAIVAARDAREAGSNSAIYATKFAHHCIDKALHIAGLGKSPRRAIATDARHRMRLDALEQAIEADRAAGIEPWLIIASAGTVDTGAVDPLADIAGIAARHGLWLHIDGAYGGLFALCEEGRAALSGIERADTLALDPHKTLFLPYGTGAVLARDGADLLRSFSATADYIRPLGESGVGPSPADLSPELTRHFRALRLWLPLQLAGVAAFRAAMSEKIGLARYFHARLSEAPGFDPGPPPDLSVVAFRYLPEHGDADAFNDRLLARIQEEGRVFLSGTRIDGHSWLRCAILSFRTHLEHVEEAVEAILETAAELEG